MRNYETIDHRRILNRTDRHPLRECLSGMDERSPSGSTYGGLFRKPRRKWKREDAGDGVLYRLRICWKRAGV